jgi:uroporphyrinogen decarboxylase
MKPLYQMVIDRVHAHGMHFILHSCGNIYYLIPELINAGVDCLQLDQPRQTGLNRLKEFCGKVAYMPVADISKVIPYSTVPEIEAEVLKMIKVLGPHNGGLIGTIYSDTKALEIPQKKMDIVEKAYRRFGNYNEYPLKQK